MTCLKQGYGKRHFFSEPNLRIVCNLTVEEIKHSFTAIFCSSNDKINSTHSSTRKTPQRRTLPMTLQLEKRTRYECSLHRCCLTLNLGDDVNKLAFRPMAAPDDRKARTTRRSFKVKDRRMTEISGIDEGARFFFYFDATGQMIELRPSPRGGPGYLTSSATPNAILNYIKPNTGGGRQLSH